MYFNATPFKPNKRKARKKLNQANKDYLENQMSNIADRAAGRTFTEGAHYGSFLDNQDDYYEIEREFSKLLDD